MPVTTVDPKTALIVIDLQQGIVSVPLAHPAADIVTRASTLTQAFRRHQLPVILVNVDGAPSGRAEVPRMAAERPAGWADLVPQLNRQPQDHLVTKRSWGAFTNTRLEEFLKSQDVTQVVIAGISTSIGVESTARQAHELGFNVSLAVDAMTDRNAEAHDNSVTRIFPRLGETGTAEQIIGALSGTRM